MQSSARHGSQRNVCPYRKSNPHVLMVQPTKHRPHFDRPMEQNGPSIGRILPQREVRAHRIIIVDVACKDVAKVPLARHYDMIQAFPPDRTDQPLGVAVLPWRACRCGMVANAERANSADEYAAVTSIPIADQIARNLLPAAGGRKAGRLSCAIIRMVSPRWTCLSFRR